MLVDCGLFQGVKNLRLRNWSALPVDAASIEAVVLTHAHIDHSGFVPRLLDLGFRGTVFATPATADLCRLLWPDSAHLQEEEARYANRGGFSRHSPALPLYTLHSAMQALKHLKTCEFGQAFSPLTGLSATFHPAGHILGAASVHLRGAGSSILFSGDLGRSDDPIMRPPAMPPAADCVLVESTYGDRSHTGDDPIEQLADVVRRTAARGGVVLIPAFAVGRAQLLLHLVAELKAEQKIPDVPVFLNSPMAADVTELFHRHPDEHRLSAAACAAMCRGVRFVNTEAQSRAINNLHYPAIVISASGMATGGRVVHHLKAFVPDARHTIVFAGYQAMGTRGASMTSGAREVKIHGQWLPVRAEVVKIDGLSAHADREDLIAWLDDLPRAPRQVFMVHGEPQAADSLRQAVQERKGWDCSVPQYLQTVEL